MRPGSPSVRRVGALLVGLLLLGSTLAVAGSVGAATAAALEPDTQPAGPGAATPTDPAIKPSADPATGPAAAFEGSRGADRPSRRTVVAGVRSLHGGRPDPDRM